MIKKIENTKNLDDIKTQLQNDGFTFDNGECVFEGMPDGIASEKDKIEYLQNSEVVYFDNKKIYGINVDELGDYEVVDFKIRREIDECIIGEVFFDDTKIFDIRLAGGSDIQRTVRNAVLNRHFEINPQLIAGLSNVEVFDLKQSLDLEDICENILEGGVMND